MRPFKRRLLHWLLLPAGALLLAAAALAWLATDSEPRVAEPRSVSHEDVARAIAILRVHDPRRGAAGMRRVVSLRSGDVELLLNQGLQRLQHDARVQVRLERRQALLLASVALPGTSGRRWLNLEADLAQTDALPSIARLRVGALPLPPQIGPPLVRWAARRSGHIEELRIARAMVQRVAFFPGLTSVAYAWDAAAPRRLMASLLPPAEQARLREYAERLAAATGKLEPGSSAPLPALMQPLFALAAERSAAGHDAAAENRAAVLTLTLHATGRSLARFVPAAAEWTAAHPVAPTLAGREDFALHFLVSAAIAIDGTSPLSKAVGIYKEVADSRNGSGFSFNDIAADRAGTRFGERALAADSAGALQKQLAAGIGDAELMPDWRDLPEFMPAAEFQRRYGGVGSPAYEAMLAEIDRRIATLPLLR